MPYRIVVEPRALTDIQRVIDYYDEQQIGLGKKFVDALEKYFVTISKNPFYQVRYKIVRCLPLRKFPFMIHYYIDENIKTVFIVSVFHTSQKPTY
jgi:toxin ParE1/3/4